MKLYDMTMAPNPRRVRIFLAEKGLEVPMEEVDIRAGANRSAEYLSVSPRGVLPALELDDGTLIDESIAICRYFEAEHPDPPLFGESAVEQAQVECWQRRVELDGFMNVAAIFRNTAPHFATRAAPGAAPDLKQIPEMAERGRALLPGFFSMLDNRLAESEYLAGDRYSIADITGLVTIDFAKWVKLDIPAEHDHVRRWHKAVSSRPSAKA